MEQSESQLRLRCLCPGMAARLLPRAARGSRLHRPVNVVVVIQALVVVVGVLVAVMGVLVVATGVLVVATGSVGVLVAVTVAVTAGRPPLACVQLTYIHTPSCDFYFMCSLAVCEVQLSHM